MTPQLPKAPLRSLFTQCRHQTTKAYSAPFSTSTCRPADDQSNPASILLDSIAPAKTSRSLSNSPITSRRPSDFSSATTSANKSLFPFPRKSGSRPDTTTAPSSNSSRTTNINTNSNPSTAGSSSSGSGSGAGDLLSTLQRTFTPAYTAATRASSAATQAEKQRLRSLEAQATRHWASGDIYAPHDLSSVEMTKARQARYATSRNNLPPANTRKKGSRDVLDDLGIDPLREYRNFAMVGEWVSEMGRIRGGRETGLRGVNQRKVARAVRRAVGLGLMPSVHRHPEMHEERMSARGRGRGF